MNKKRRIFMSVSTALIMSFCMSLVMVFVNLGFSPIFFLAWMRGWLIGFIVALPLAFIVPHTIQKIADRLGL